MLSVTDMSKHDITTQTHLKYCNEAKLLKKGYIGELSQSVQRHSEQSS